MGTKISSLPTFSSELKPQDYFPFVSTDGTPTTKRVAWAVFRSLFVRRVAPPSDSTTPGTIGDYSSDATYVYYHNGILWGRWKPQFSNWQIEPIIAAVQKGRWILSENVTSVTVPYPVAFVGTPPKITSMVFGNTAAGNNQILHAVVVSETLTNFTFELSGPTDNATYTVTWTAEQI
jgi:hypothetical protein